MYRTDSSSHESQPQTIPGTMVPIGNRLENVSLLTLVLSLLTALAAVGLIALDIYQPAWQFGTLAVLFAGTSIYGIFAVRYFYPRRLVAPGLGGISVGFGVSLLVTSCMLSGMGLPIAIVYLVFSLIVSSITINDKQANLSIGIGIVISSLSALANDYSPLPQVSNQMIGIVTPAILGGLFMIYVVMLVMQFVSATLRIRLVTAFMAIVILPLMLLSIIQSQFTFGVLNREVDESLRMAAKQAANGIDSYFAEREQLIQEAAKLKTFVDYLSYPAEFRSGTVISAEMQMALRALDTNNQSAKVFLSSYALIDSRGMKVYDTMIDRAYNRFGSDSLKNMGIDLEPIIAGGVIDESGEDYFKIPMTQKTTYISQVIFPKSTNGFFFISAPVMDDNGKPLGVFLARYDAQLLQDLVKEYSGLLGMQSYAVLVDDNNLRLADAYTPNYINKTIAPRTIDQVHTLINDKRLPNLPADALSTDFEELGTILDNLTESVPVFRSSISPSSAKTNLIEVGAIARLHTRPWKVIYLRSDFNDEDLRREQRQLSTLVTVLVAGIVGLIAVVTAQLLSNPIIQLTKTAQKIAEGDLTAQAPTGNNDDEFGLLGTAFNIMTNQMRTLIVELEERVKARTAEIEAQNNTLANRARQFQTISDVARQIVSAQELEKLLAIVTQLVSERFGFYHVGVFLIDESKQHAVLRAANSEGGQRMLARHHMLPVGKMGIVGYATGVGEPRIATDVGEDAVFFNNPDLPDTRSEMAIPLKVGDQVIGALDIQSTESNAFHADDIELFTTMADQVAIAIYNNQLYTETLHALNESETAHRQYLQAEWAEDTSRRKVLGYVFNQSGITPQKAENPLWKKVFASGEPVYAALPSSNGAPDNAVMAVPIAVRGETIGVIHVQDQGDDRMWSEDEVAVVNSIASQVAVALENARLFENTVRRAEREKKVLQITAKIRSTNDPEEMMQIAVSELQQALHATRTQIYIRQEEAGPEKESTPANTNGRSKHSADKPSADL